MKNPPEKTRGFIDVIGCRHLTFFKTAILFLLFFAACHLAGWRDATSIISGTSTSADFNTAVTRGVLYALSYFLAVIVSPILILASGINAVIRRLWQPSAFRVD